MVCVVVVALAIMVAIGPVKSLTHARNIQGPEGGDSGADSAAYAGAPLPGVKGSSEGPWLRRFELQVAALDLNAWLHICVDRFDTK